MLSGVGPVPAVLFVVAADDPWMPQAAEHLAAIDGLGVRHGLLAVTRADLTDPEPARKQALEEIRRTSLGDVPVRRGLGPHRCGARRAAASPRRPRGCAARPRSRRRRADLGRPVLPRPGRRHRGHRHAPGRHRLGRRRAAARRRPRSGSGGSSASARPSPRRAASAGSPSTSRAGCRPDSAGGASCSRRGWPRTDSVDVRLTGRGVRPERPRAARRSGVPRGARASAGRHDGPAHAREPAAAAGRRPRAAARSRAAVRRGGSRCSTRSRRRCGVAAPRPGGPGSSAAADGSVYDEVRRRGIVSRSALRRIGVDPVDVPAGVEVLGEWLLLDEHARALREQLRELVRDGSTPARPGGADRGGGARARPAATRRSSRRWCSRRCGSSTAGSSRGSGARFPRRC